MVGDGLVRPVNAPAGQSTPVGVQPGVTGGVVLANKVIVSGGAGSGIFAYSPAPGLNNLVYSETQSSADPFGNQTVPGTTVYQGNIALNMVASGITVYANSSGQTGTWSQLGTFFLTTPAAVSYWYSTLGLVTAMPSFAQQPGTVPPPVVPETWHPMTLAGGWTGTAQYKLLPDNTVMIRTSVSSIGGGANANGTQIWTAPPGYIPTVAQQSIPLIVSAVGAGAAAAVSPFLLITSAGALTVNNIAGQNATNLRFCGTYALD